MASVDDPVRSLPVGTVTFLRTDIEGSMHLARSLGRRWDVVNTRHLDLLRAALEAHGGTLVRTEGDAILAAFGEASSAVAAAVDAQRALAAEQWTADVEVRVRMGLHSGEAHLAGDDYGGFDVNRAARVAAAAHGGQVVLSASTVALVEDMLPDGVSLLDLGEHRLRDVPRPERIAQLCIAGLPDAFPPLRTGGPVRGDLPDRLTTFLGRDEELDAIRGLLEHARLITLTGPGGIGKSSLAVEAARMVAQDYPDGAWFVPLADVVDPAEVPAAVAHGIGLRDGPERSAATALLPFIADRRLLIVLDNMEQLADAAGQVAAIVRASPGSRIIVTSRAPLHVNGENDLPVAPLAQDAVALFRDRARAVRPGWEPGDDRSIVEDICRLLDDLPLGIELAAARVTLLSPTAIRDRLMARLPLPGSGPRDAPMRQRTLDGAVAWSHDQLDPDRQALLHILAVFDGGFDLAQVDAVAGPTSGGGDRLDDLVELADRSLIVADPSGAGRPRFRMLRTIQSFALDRLIDAGLEADSRRRHADAYLALATEGERHLSTSQHAIWLDRVGPEQANLRAALRWAIETDQGELALRFVAVLWRFWHAFGQIAEGRRLAEAAMALPSAPRAGSVRAWAVAAMGNIAYWQGDSATARRWYEDQVALAKAANDEACVADGVYNLGHVAFIGREDEAVQHAYIDEVIARYRDLGDERGAARAAWARGILALGAGRFEEAAGSLDQALVDFERLDDPQYRAMTMGSLGWAAFAQGDVPTAARMSVEALLGSYRMRDIGTTTISLHIGVLMAGMLGRYEDAAVINGAFDALCDRYGVRPPAALERFIGTSDPFVATREALEPEVYAAAYARGSDLSLDEAVALVVDIAASMEPAAATAEPGDARRSG